MYSMAGVKCKDMPAPELRKICRRGLPWTQRMVKIGADRTKCVVENHAWLTGAADAFEGDLHGTISSVLVQMFRRKAKGIGMEREDMDFLDHISK